MALRLLPVLLIALVLTAWQYRWQQVVLVSLGIAALDLGLRVLLQPLGTRAFHAGFLVTIIQTTCFLVIGYFISRLMPRLRTQQAALQGANTQLMHYASTLEDLTISRERNRMARKLHDTLAHTLSALSVQLETVKAYWEVDAEAAQALLDQSLQVTRAGLQETRRALKSFRGAWSDQCRDCCPPFSLGRNGAQQRERYPRQVGRRRSHAGGCHCDSTWVRGAINPIYRPYVWFWVLRCKKARNSSAFNAFGWGSECTSAASRG
jgi:hypothetical protein